MDYINNFDKVQRLQLVSETEFLASRAKKNPAIGLAGLTPQQFLKQYWQKEPLLIRNAFEPFPDLPSKDEVASLACEEGVQSRLVLQNSKKNSWTVNYGPFNPKEFKKLPKTHWTLLVQDVDKILPGVAKILEKFKFIPNWRLDDVMISYGADKGSVGAHVDQYDVFLMQVGGKKLWQIDSKKIENEDYIEGLELKILKTFTPSSEWELNPGDMLYLPPGIAHHGVAVGDSLTYSVGFRAPSERELLENFFTWALAKSKNADHRYSDADFALQKEPGEITDAALKKIRETLDLIPKTTDEITKWFGSYISKPKHEFAPAEPKEPIMPKNLKARLDAKETLTRDESTSIIFRRLSAKETALFINGECIVLKGKTAALAPLLSRQRTFSAADFKSKDDLEFVAKLFNRGFFYFSPP